jgi:hypothetical protein
VAHVVSDRLEREIGINEPLDAGVPECVGTCTVDLDASFADIVRDSNHDSG